MFGFFFYIVTFILFVKTNIAEQSKQGPLSAANNEANEQTCWITVYLNAGKLILIAELW